MRHHPAVDDGGDDVAQARVRLELILAGLEVLARLEDENAADEHPRLLDDAFTGEHVGDIANAGAVRNVDDAVGRQRARRVEALLADHQADAGGDRRQHEQADDRVADDHERIACAFGAACRHFDLIGLQRGARTARRYALRIFRIRGSADAVDQLCRKGRVRFARRGGPFRHSLRTRRPRHSSADPTRRRPPLCLPASRRQPAPHAAVAAQRPRDHRLRKPIRLGARAVAPHPAPTPMWSWSTAWPTALPLPRATAPRRCRRHWAGDWIRSPPHVRVCTQH